MKFFSCLAVLFSLIFSSPIQASEPQLILNNRVLAKVNGKAITVVDVTKKMDMILLRQYPEEFASHQVRYQFYQANWQRMLSDLIDRELVVLASEELNWPVPTGDIRQELEEIFGPNVRLNLETAGLTYDEVWQMLRSDILIRRMLSLQVNARVLAEITPQKVQAAYDDYVKNSSLHEEYSYRMLSFKSHDSSQAMEVAQVAHMLLSQEKLFIDKLQDALQAKGLLTESVKMTLSSTFTQKQDVLVQAVKETLASLEVGSISKPLEQRSRVEGAPIVRIYFLEGKKGTEPATFAELEPKIKDEMIKNRLAEETGNYFARLRKHFDVRLEEIEKELPANFTPYALEQNGRPPAHIAGMGSQITDMGNQ